MYFIDIITYIIAHLKSNIASSKEINDEDSKFKIVDIVTIWKHKNIFAKGYVPNWSEEVFVIKKAENTVPWTHIIKFKKVLERFTKKNCKKQIKKRLELKRYKEKRW